MIVGITYSTKYIDSLGGESITGSWANIRRLNIILKIPLNKIGCTLPSHPVLEIVASSPIFALCLAFQN